MYGMNVCVAAGKMFHVIGPCDCETTLLHRPQLATRAAEKHIVQQIVKVEVPQPFPPGYRVLAECKYVKELFD